MGDGTIENDFGRKGLKIQTEKVFNNEDEFGIIPNKHLKGRRLGSKKQEKRTFSVRTMLSNSLQSDLYIDQKRFIYRSFSFYI
ncbi:hypothetical protein HMPREF1989_01699 [Porphyromonas gingivalis F0566]|nr:hypothetical protein HMPREF1989_01699 [Porphyromonas gingivalis F0566]